MKPYYSLIIGIGIVTLILIFCLLKFFNKKSFKIQITTRQVTKDAILLTLLILTGMFSVPMGENIKVSLQFLTLIIVFALCDTLFDCLLIPTIYLLIGLFIPVYAGFIAGITPTFGFVLAFIIAAIPFWFIFHYLKINLYIRFVIASLLSLAVVYFGGALFFMFYMGSTIEFTLLVTVVPYIPFDIAKIAIATIVTGLLFNSLNIKTNS